MITGGSPVTEGGDVTFTLTADPAPASDIQVTVSVSETGSFAASGETGARTVTIGTSGTVDFTVATEDDATDEADGSIAATVTAGTGYTVGSVATASVTVADNEVPTVNITSAAGGSEGEEVTFILTAIPAPSAELPVNVTVTGAGDYGITAGTRTVSIPTSGSFTLTLSTTDDEVDEDDGSVTLTLETGVGYTVGALSSQTVAITDDDVTTQQQTDSGNTNPHAALIARVRVYVGETENGEEHVKRWQRVLKALGEKDAAFTNLTPMTATEAQTYADRGWTRWDEVVTALTALEAAAQPPAQPPVQPPVQPTISIAGGSAVTEGGEVTFTLTANPAPAASLAVTVSVTESGSVASSGATGTRTVTVGTSGTVDFTVATEDDSTDEADGSIAATITTGTGYTVGSAATASVTVADNDVPTVSITGGSAVTEGGDVSFTLTASPAPASDIQVTVSVTESGNVASSGATGTRTVTVGTSRTVDFTVATEDDAVDEADGSIAATVTAGTGYRVGSAATASVTVTDNDVPTISITGGSAVTEGGDVSFTLTASPAPAASLAVTVSVTESGNVASSGATGARTVTVGTSGTVDFTVATEDDAVDEADGSIAATVTAGTGYRVGSAATASVTVADNDVPTVSITGGSAVTEGGEATFTLTADPAPAASLAVTVSVTENGNIAGAGATGTRTVTIGTSGTVDFTVATEDDAVDEADGSIAATITAGTGYRVGSAATASVTVADNDVPTVSITSAAGGSEGDDVTFTITATPAPAANLAVNVTVTGAGDYGISGGARTVSIPTGGSVTLRLSTTDDAVDEEDGSVTLSLETGTGYTVGALSSRTASITDDDVTTQQQQTDSEDTNPVESQNICDFKPMLSVSDASGREGEALEFVVSLSRPREDGMSVLVRTRESDPVSARHGQDFRLRSDGQDYALLTFHPGDREKTVLVSTLDDVHDDDGETFELYIDRVYFADGVGIADGVGVGTIVNSDPMPAAWLGRFGRTVSQQVVDAVRGRFKAAPVVGLDLTVAGEHLSGVPLEENEGALRKLLGFESVRGEQVVADSSFSFSPPAAADAAGGDGGVVGQWSVWGQGAVSSFSGQEEELSLSGDVSTVLLGADWRAGRWQAGAALSRSWGSGGYQGEGDDGADGSIGTVMTGLFPYGRYALSPRLGVWAIGGYGWGDLTLKPERDGGEELSTTTNLVMGAVGLEGVVLDGGADGLSLTTTADALVVETVSAKTTGLKGSAATVSRLRLGLEATRPFPMDNGALLLPSLEVGLRQDSGDAETGYGVEVGAGVIWTAPQHGIRGELRGRSLVTHTEEEFRQQGLALSFAWDPSPSNRGPSLSMGHTMGAATAGGMDALLSPTVIQGLDGPASDGQHFEAQLAYGFPFHHDRLTLSPAVALALSPDSRSYAIRWSLTPYSQQGGQSESWEVTLEAQRQEHSSSPAQHSLKLDLSLTF